MDELRPGLWTWTARHPEWSGPEADWEPEVRSYALEAGETLVLFDPLSPPPRVEELASGREIAVLLTVWYHVRSAAELAERLGATVHAPLASLADLPVEAEGYEPGARLPGGVAATTGHWSNEATLWIREHRALVTGDVLLGAADGIRVQPDDWFEDGARPEDVRAGLRPLLELPVELLLPTHGDPVDTDATDALRRALEG